MVRVRGRVRGKRDKSIAYIEREREVSIHS